MNKKKFILNPDRYYYFNTRDIDTFKRMVYLCIKFRMIDDISYNAMWRLWKKIKELS